MKEAEILKYYHKYLGKIVKHLGNSTTTDKDLTSYGKKIFGNRYLGTYSSDTIPKMKAGTYTIVNLDSSNEPGSHWIALVKTEKDILVYDSFGRKTISILPSIYDQKGNGIILEAENDPEQKMKEKN